MKKKPRKKLSYWGVFCPSTPIGIWNISKTRENARIRAGEYRGRYNHPFWVCKIEVQL